MIEDVVVTASKTPQWRVQLAIPKPKGRQRVWHSKARTGCLTCKRRRVRCDEGKPTCSRCRKAKIECEGYTPLKTWLFEKSDGSSTSSPSVSGILTDHEGRLVRNVSPSSDELTKFENRALQFFQEKTAPILSTFAPSATHFWCNIVPRLSLSNEIVRSSLIAISSLHESKHYRQVQEASPVADRVFAEHYTKTVSALTNRRKPPPPEVILITCFIFIACENIKLVGSAPAELMHVRSGLRVLREWKANNRRHGSITADSMHDVMQNLLEPMFARLEAQIFIMREPEASRTFFREYDLNWIEPVIPTSFPDLFAARDSINDCMQWLWYNTQVAGGPLFANTLAFKSVNRLMKQWSQTFKSSFPLLQDRDWPAWKAAAALQIHWTALQICLQAEALDSIVYWDLCHNQVEWMLATCEEIICSEGPISSATDTSSSLWLYDFCLNPPLFLIANNCRHPDLRRHSVELMRKQHQWLYVAEDDGSYCWTAFTCDVIISLEESRTNTSLSPKPSITTAEAVLETSRIRPMQIIMAVPGQVTVRYMRSPFVEMQEYTVAWDKWTTPAIDQVTMWPFGEQVKHGNYQGLIRPLRRKCLCRSFGTPVADAWTVPL